MITLHTATATDFSTLGLGALTPTECTVSEESGGAYELQLRQPVDNTLRHAELKQFRIIKAPVPARETPLLSETEQTTETVQVQREIYRVSVRSRLRLRAKPSTSSAIINSYKNGTRVIVLEKTNDSWYKVSIENGGASGYMSTQYLRYVETKTDTITTTVDTPGKVVNVMQSREQLFRIESVEADTRENVVIVNAKHISYDVSGAIVNATYEPENVAASEVCRQLVSKLDHDISPFEIYCNIDTKISGDYSGKNLLECLLDSENGVAAKCKARVFRDNYTIYILPDETRDLGMQIRYGKNLLSASMTTDTSDIITRIKPVGRNKDGEDLYINENNGFVDSEHINEYPVIYAKKIEYDVVEGDDLSQSAAIAKLKELAQEDFKSGIDMPKVSLNSDFVRLELTEKYKALANAYSLHIYDSARVVADDYSINVLVRMVKYTFDCIQQRYTKTELGDITETSAAVYGYEIARGSLDGNRLVSNTVNGDKLRNLSIEYAKISNATIGRLAADAIVAIRADIHEIVAGQITTDELYVDLAKIALAEIANAEIDIAQIKDLTAEIAKITQAQISEATITVAQIQDLNAAVATIADARIAEATIDAAQIDNLSAVVADAIHATIEVGDFTLAEIKNLLANSLILEEGIANSMMITNLAVTSANILSATLDKLVVRGKDGNYYHVFVGADGVVSTEETTVSAGEIEAGETQDGRQIVASTANVASLNATTIKASQAIIATIFTESLTAGKITAGDALIASATIPTLYVTSLKAIGDSIDISANASITSVVSSVSNAQSTANAAQSSADAAQSAAENAQSTANAAQSAASNAQTAADGAQTAADNAQSTADVAQNSADFAAPHYGDMPPPAPVPEGKVWIDSGAEPIAVRRWKGLDVSPDRSYKETIQSEGIPAVSIGNSDGHVREIALEAGCVSIQSGSGDPSPQNIRPITGRSSVEVRACGRNLLDSARINNETQPNTIVEIDGNSVRIAADSLTYRCGRTHVFLPPGNYIIAADIKVTKGTNRIGRRISADGGQTYPAVLAQHTGGNQMTFTVQPGEEWNQFTFFCSFTNAEAGDVTYSNIRLYSGSSADDFEPYHDLGGGLITPSTALYGVAGAEDVIEVSDSGAVRAIHRTGITTFDGVSRSFVSSSFSTPEGTFAYSASLRDIGALSIDNFKGICSHFSIIPRNSALSKRVAGTMMLGVISDGSAQVWIFSDQPSLSEFKAWISAQYAAGTPVTIVYELAEPVTETLAQITPIEATNDTIHITSDSANLSADLTCSGWENVSDTSGLTQDVEVMRSTIQQLVDEIALKVAKGDLETYLRLMQEGVYIGKSDSIYRVFIDDAGMHVQQYGEDIAVFAKRTLITPYIRVGPPDSPSGLAISKASDGGMMITNLGVIV